MHPSSHSRVDFSGVESFLSSWMFNGERIPRFVQGECYPEFLKLLHE
jgi:hypothetical protein